MQTLKENPTATITTPDTKRVIPKKTLYHWMHNSEQIEAVAMQIPFHRFRNRESARPLLG